MKISVIYLAATLASAVLSLGCEREGPAERAGKQLDDAAASIGEGLEDASEEFKNAVRREP